MSLVGNKNNSSKDSGPSNLTYEIVMVAIAAAIMLVCGLIFIVLALKRHWSVGGIHNANYAEEGAVSSISLTRTSPDSISTADLRGPVYVNYINEKGEVPSEIPIGRVKLSREALLYISLVTSINLLDHIDSEESL